MNINDILSNIEQLPKGEDLHRYKAPTIEQEQRGDMGYWPTLLGTDDLIALADHVRKLDTNKGWMSVEDGLPTEEGSYAVIGIRSQVWEKAWFNPQSAGRIEEWVENFSHWKKIEFDPQEDR